MIEVKTGSFTYEFSLYELDQPTSLFSSDFAEITDKGLRALIAACGSPEYSDHTNTFRRTIDFEEALEEAIDVLSAERKAVIYKLVSNLAHDAFMMGSLQALVGLDPIARKKAAEKMLRARAAKTTPEREAVIEEAIRAKGPKVANIQKELRRRGFDLSDDAIRARKKSRVNSGADQK